MHCCGRDKFDVNSVMQGEKRDEGRAWKGNGRSEGEETLMEGRGPQDGEQDKRSSRGLLQGNDCRL